MSRSRGAGPGVGTGVEFVTCDTGGTVEKRREWEAYHVMTQGAVSCQRCLPAGVRSGAGAGASGASVSAGCRSERVEVGGNGLIGGGIGAVGWG